MFLYVLVVYGSIAPFENKQIRKSVSKEYIFRLIPAIEALKVPAVPLHGLLCRDSAIGNPDKVRVMMRTEEADREAGAFHSDTAGPCVTDHID